MFNPFRRKPARLTPDEARRLGALYLDARTTVEEERRLLRFVLSPEGQAAEFDSLRAVLTFCQAAAGQPLAPSLSVEKPSLSVETSSLSVEKGKPSLRRRRRRRLRRTAAAVSVAACLAAGAFFLARADFGSQDVCVAYIDGKKITDEDVVMARMHASLADVIQQDADVEEQIRNIFNP